MGAEGSGLTLEGLALRLEALERENTELRSKVTTLEGSDMLLGDEVAELRSSGTPRTGDGEPASEWSGFEGKVSRRGLLSKAGAAAVAAVAAGTLLNTREAKATHDPSWFDGFNVEWLNTHYITAYPETPGHAVYGESSSNAFATVQGRNFGTGGGVKGYSTHSVTPGEGIGVIGEGASGVLGVADYKGRAGVTGQNTSLGGGYGVVGDGKGAGNAGVLGRNSGGEGVRGVGSTLAEVAGVRGLGKTGVWGSTAVSGYSGVYGQNTGSGFGVVGDGQGSSGAGVFGRNPSGYGGQFDGGKAQLKLNPKGTAGKPTSGAHTKGEIYMDSAGTLFVCTANGTPGTWRKVTTTAV